MEDPLLTLSQQSKLASEVYRHVDPLNFYNNFLKEGIRPDGRGICSYRKITVKNLLESNSNFKRFESAFAHNASFDVNYNNQHDFLSNTRLITSVNKNVLFSSIYLSCGNSRFHCKIFGDLVNTPLNNWVLTSKELENTFSVDVTVPKHVVGDIYDINGPCTNISHLVSDLLENVLNSSQIIPKEQFLYYDLYLKLYDNDSGLEGTNKILNYFKKYQLRWNLSIKIICDEYDGNILDMCFLCCSHALLHSKIPFVLLYPDNNIFYSILFNHLVDINTLSNHESLLNNQELIKLIDLNKDLLQLQTRKFGSSPTDVNSLLKTLIELGHNRMDFNYIPLTFTFCKCLNYFLLDPTMEDEQTGVNYSIYALKKWDRNSNANTKNAKDNVFLQPLNLMGLNEVDDETLNRLYEVVDLILESFFQ